MAPLPDPSTEVVVDVPTWVPIGLEVPDPPRFTPPEVRPGPPVWDPYYGPRFSRRTRLAISAVLLGPPAALVLLGLLMVVIEAGTAKMGGFLCFVLVVPALPVAAWIYRDLWLARR